MTSTNFYQEIILFTSTRYELYKFFQPLFHDAGNSTIDTLLQACWAGLVYKLLPELTINQCSACNVFTWNIRSSKDYLLVNQGTEQCPVDSPTSVHPNLFISALSLN